MKVIYVVMNARWVFIFGISDDMRIAHVGVHSFPF